MHAVRIHIRLLVISRRFLGPTTTKALC